MTSLEKEIYERARKLQIPCYFLKKNGTVQFDGFAITNLNKAYDNENDSSLVLYTQIFDRKILLLGDISALVEKELILEYSFDLVDILKIAHHGSATSSSEEFLKKFFPKLAVISVGKNNFYHHPAEKVLNRLETLQIFYSMTKDVGSIQVDLKNGTIVTFPP